MKIAILGTRGIPNNYGGFEQLAEFLSVALVKRGHEVYVYNSSLHPYNDNQFLGVNIISCEDPEDKFGTFGQFIYDYHCIVDSRKRKFDVIIQLGYTSNAIWWFLLPKKSTIFTNMDGLEWMRSKYSKSVKLFLKFSEWIAVKSSDYLIADSIGIQEYLLEKHNAISNFIPYGANAFYEPNKGELAPYHVEAKSYYLVIARFEKENNLECIIEGYLLSKTKTPLLIIGSLKIEYAQYLKSKFESDKIMFLGSIFNMNTLNNLRYYSKMYFHGHTVGGTNPSLLEAMASQAFICANNNQFNKSVLGNDAIYFNNKNEICELINKEQEENFIAESIKNNLCKIEKEYQWSSIVDAYENLITTNK